MGQNEDQILCIVKDPLKPILIQIHYDFYNSLGRRVQKLKTQAQISRLCIFNNTPEHELGSPKLLKMS